MILTYFPAICLEIRQRMEKKHLRIVGESTRPSSCSTTNAKTWKPLKCSPVWPGTTEIECLATVAVDSVLPNHILEFCGSRQLAVDIPNVHHIRFYSNIKYRPTNARQCSIHLNISITFSIYLTLFFITLQKSQVYNLCKIKIKCNHNLL